MCTRGGKGSNLRPLGRVAHRGRHLLGLYHHLYLRPLAPIHLSASAYTPLPKVSSYLSQIVYMLRFFYPDLGPISSQFS